MNLKNLIALTFILFLFSCSQESNSSDFEVADSIFTNQNREYCPDGFFFVNIYYDPQKVAIEDIPLIRGQYFITFNHLSMMRSNIQPNDPYHDIWCYFPSRPEGDLGAIGDVLDDDPRAGTTPP